MSAFMGTAVHSLQITKHNTSLVEKNTLNSLQAKALQVPLACGWQDR
jgi:hypothetical protein